MIIYNKMWLNNLRLHRLFEDEHEAGCLTDHEIKLLKQKYTVGFYRPGIIARIGLFVLTLIILFFSLGLASLIFADARIIDNPGWPMFLGTASYIILETMVKNKHYYQSGVDEALLWVSASLFSGGFIWMLESINGYHNTNYNVISIFIFVLSTVLTLRYADLLMTAIAVLSCQAFVFFNWKDLGSFGTSTLPFVMMALSGLLYYLLTRINKNPKAVYYDNCIDVGRLVCLLTLYLSGNYFVVSELSTSFLGTAPGTPVPFGLIFWTWTILLPLVYITWGLKEKDTIILRTGLLLIVASVFTFRTYYHVMSIEVALAAGGAVLLAISYFAIKYLKTARNGITYAEPKRKSALDSLNLESLIIGETFGQASHGPTGPVNPFGGGTGGGGGSSSNY
jgi:hypothetical protein